MNWIKREEDNPNIKSLTRYRLPIISNVNQLVEILNITEKQEKLYFYKDLRNKYLYKKVNIPKKNGNIRTLEVPIDSLKIIQKAINNVILSSFNMSKEANAYIKKKSIITNALPHIEAKTLIKIDLKDFFPSINYSHVYSQFRFFGYGNNVSKYLSLLCVNGDLKLPQGAPTSPTISNLICILLDNRISSYCKNKNMNYSRYADDITLSSKKKLQKDEIFSIKNFIYYVINDSGFTPNDEKFKYFYDGNKLQVTGIVVNNKISVDKCKRRELENAIRYIGKFGIESHMKYLQLEKNNYVGHLYGLANYIKMIDREKGEVYLKQLNELNIR